MGKHVPVGKHVETYAFFSPEIIVIIVETKPLAIEIRHVILYHCTLVGVQSGLGVCMIKAWYMHGALYCQMYIMHMEHCIVRCASLVARSYTTAWCVAVHQTHCRVCCIVLHHHTHHCTQYTTY